MENRRKYSQGICLLRTLYYALFLIRFNLLMLAAGWVLLLVPQGQDAIISYAAYDRPWTGVLFFFWASYWALSIWFFARSMYKFDFPLDGLNLDGKFFDWLRAMLPRLLGPLCFVAVAHALLNISAEDAAGTRIERWTWIAVALVPVSFAFFYFRRPLTNRLLDFMRGDKLEGFKRSMRSVKVEEEPSLTTLGQVFGGAWGKFLIFISVVGISATIAGFSIPVEMGFFFGAILVFFIWAGSWLPLGSFVTYLGNKRGYPMIALLLVLAILFSAGNDNHGIRLGEAVAKRPHLDSTFSVWKNAEPGQRDLVLVSTAGGGIRAAYWTATVLGELGKTDGFEESLFAISGVSGGSVGASVYRALLSDGVASGEIQQRAQDVLSYDFLGPVTTALLYPDLAQRFLPNMNLMDRGKALELAWEAAYTREMQSDRMSQPLMQVYKGQQNAWPALLLNATRVETGRRSVASNLRFDHLHGGEEGFFAVVDDQLADIGRDVLLSAAAHNSARFPGVSPAGHWRDANGDIAGRLVDGGYFENYGAETILDLLRVIENRAGDGNGGLTVNLHVVAISSDPALTNPYSKQPQREPTSRAHEIMSPLNTLLNTRTARGIEALHRLQVRTEALGGSFYHLRMWPPAGESQASGPPLGWTLSENARSRIEGYLVDPRNRSQIDALRMALAGQAAEAR